MNSFAEIEEKIGRFASFIDYPIVAFPPKRRREAKIAAWILIVNFAVALTELIGYSYYVRDDLLRLLIQAELIAMDILAIVSIYCMVSHFDICKSLMTWCSSRHALQNPLEVIVAKKFYDRAQANSLKAIDFWYKLIVTLMVVILPVNTLFSLVLGQKHPLPFPFIIPFLPPTNQWSFWINLAHQYLAAVIVCLLAIVIGSILYIFVFYIYASASSLLYAVEKMGVLTRDHSFLEWYDLVFSMMVEEKRYFGNLKKIVLIPTYVLEKVSYACLFVSLLIFKLSKKDSFLSLGALIVVFIILLLCIINETFREKYEDICVALYECPWYELKPKERKLLVPLLLGAQDYKGISAGGLKNMTFEYFSDLVNSSYSTALILEKMIVG